MTSVYITQCKEYEFSFEYTPGGQQLLGRGCLSETRPPVATHLLVACKGVNVIRFPSVCECASHAATRARLAHARCLILYRLAVLRCVPLWYGFRRGSSGRGPGLLALCVVYVCPCV